MTIFSLFLIKKKNVYLTQCIFGWDCREFIFWFSAVVVVVFCLFLWYVVCVEQFHFLCLRWSLKCHRMECAFADHLLLLLLSLFRDKHTTTTTTTTKKREKRVREQASRIREREKKITTRWDASAQIWESVTCCCCAFLLIFSLVCTEKKKKSSCFVSFSCCVVTVRWGLAVRCAN